MPKKQTTRHSSIKMHVHRRAKLALVPHKANQYRPHAVRRFGLALIVVFALIIQVAYNSFTNGSVLGTQAQITSTGLLAATNQARTEQGEAPLVLNEKLASAARLKAQNMFQQQYWSHTAPDGTTPWHWFGTVDYAYAEAGENLAKNFTTSTSTVAAWLASSTHRANILKPDYQDVGFAVMEGVLNSKPTTLIVALYGTPEGASVYGMAAPQTNISTTGATLSVVDRVGLGLQSLTPAAIASIVILLVGANIALVAHLYRRKLPPTLRRSWYRHHGLYKAVGLTSIAVIVVFAYGGVGQI